MIDFPVVLFNPRSADAKHRIPNSILQIGGACEGLLSEYYFVDGNLEKDPLKTLSDYIENKRIRCLGVTVMPGPQLQQAIPFSKILKQRFPELIIVWGGYFATNQHKVVLDSGFVDYVINGPGDEAFPQLLQHLYEHPETAPNHIQNLIYYVDGKLMTTRKESLPNMDALPPFPYQKLNAFYPLEHYIAKTFMGKRTFSYHSSFGCPFTCSFCAVVPIYNARWKGLSPERLSRDIRWFKEHYAIDAVEFHDNNFFTSRSRVVAFAEQIKDLGIAWWGEGRIDTIHKYSDTDLHLLRDAGLKMIFLGAETGNDEVLKQMDKGGTQTGAQIKAFAKRLGEIGITPEYSFVLGLPAENESKVWKMIRQDIQFIREIKHLNSDTEIILYVYSPVPTEGSELYEQIQAQGFSFPATLEDWLSPAWERFDLRKNPLTPWLSAKHIRHIRNFEVVLNAYYPSKTDFRITGWKRVLLRLFAVPRYHLKWYAFPYEIKLLLRWWKYRQPEEQGFYSE